MSEPHPTAEQIQIVQQSWDAVMPRIDEIAERFYPELFALDPALRALFPEDLAGQRAKLIAMLSLAIKGLDHVAVIEPAIAELGRRHAGYRVTPAMYRTMETALLATLGAVLGPAFDDETRAAWRAVYGLLARTMVAGTATTDDDHAS